MPVTNWGNETNITYAAETYKKLRQRTEGFSPSVRERMLEIFLSKIPTEHQAAVRAAIEAALPEPSVVLAGEPPAAAMPPAASALGSSDAEASDEESEEGPGAASAARISAGERGLRPEEEDQKAEIGSDGEETPRTPPPKPEAPTPAPSSKRKILVRALALTGIAAGCAAVVAMPKPENESPFNYAAISVATLVAFVSQAILRATF